MIALSATTDNVQVVLGGSITTSQLDCFSTWRDITTTSYTPGRTVVATNNTTDVNIVPAPASSTQRVVDYLSVYNKDTVTQTVTIKYDANGTDYTLWKGALQTGERVCYVDGTGFRTFSQNGAPVSQAIQTYASYTSNSLSSVVLAGDVVNNNAVANTIADVTGLSFAVVAGNTYWFRFVIPYTSAATGTGSRWSISGPSSPTLLNYTSRYTVTATTETFNYATAYDIPAAANASSLTAGNVAIIEGHIKPSGNGTVIARFASEVANSAIVAKAGAVLFYQQVL